MSVKSSHVEIYRERRSNKDWTPNLDKDLAADLSDSYTDKWRWRFRSSNGKILSRSSESYNDPRDLVRGLELSFPGYQMLDSRQSLLAYGGWYLWRNGTYADAIPVRVPDGTVKLWRSRRNR